MDRREALKRTSVALGGILSAGVVTGVLEGCTPDSVKGESLTILTEDQANVLEAIADRIIPRTETAGAADVPLGAYMDRMLDKYYLKDIKIQVLEQLESFMLGDRANLTELDDEEKDTLVSSLATQAKSNDQRGDNVASLFHVVKEMTFIGFFSSEVGATTVLQYEQTPGSFNGCISLEQAGGRTWAL